MLWLAADLPLLSLEALAEPADDEHPLAVTASRGSRRWLLCANDAALQAGMDLGLARSLRADLRVRERQPAREAAALETLACAAYAFGDRIHWRSHHEELDYTLPRHVLWLDIGPSLKLFGGIEPLSARLQAEFTALGHAARFGIAPTLEAAAALARAGGAPVLTPAALPEALAPLPLDALNLPADTANWLLDLGIRSVGELLALPRPELGRRCGRATLDQLDRLLGLRSDTRRGYRPPPRFVRRVDFAEDIDTTERLAFPLRRLVGELVRYLRARASGVAQFRLELRHARTRSDERPPSWVDLRLSAPSRDEGLLLRVLRERLAATALQAPVCAIGLHAEHFAEPPVAQHDLFDLRARSDEQLAAVIDRLVARLGNAAVWCPTVVEDHRPERACRSAAPGGTGKPATLPAAPRPGWLLKTARRLDRPPLIDGDVERIESGWWDGGDVRRDYFSCTLPNGTRGWVYVDKRDGQQYLHGLWG